MSRAQSLPVAFLIIVVMIRTIAMLITWSLMALKDRRTMDNETFNTEPDESGISENETSTETIDLDQPLGIRAYEL